MMRLDIFEKSENLGPTILTRMWKIAVASGIFTFYEKIHFSKISKNFRELKNYISYILINN